MKHTLSVLGLAALVALGVNAFHASGRAQVREFDFYAEFRQWRMAMPDNGDRSLFICEPSLFADERSHLLRRP